METTKIVFLWSHIRAVSTAFERAFIQREDYVTFHEPFAEPCYFGPERMYTYYDDELSEHAECINTTYSDIIEKILKAATNGENKNIFVKDMVRHVVRSDYKLHPENPTLLPLDFLKRCKHTFLLRTPEKSIPSLYRVYLKKRKEFIYEETGYPEFQVLFDFLTKVTGSRPALVDASDLLADPKAVMRIYCESAIHDRFEPSMLEWTAGRIKAFEKWPGWYDEAQESTGFNMVQRTTNDIEDLVLPDDMQQLIKESMAIYNRLYEFRIIV